ncbi:MAG TPA: ATP-binding protein, partial [Actinomycetes bacterium]|nr:ATP-binding protein [Actinomycetes bacterium]
RSLVDLAGVAHEAALAAGVCHPGRYVQVESGGPLPVNATAAAVLQVLDNAAKYSFDGTPIRLEALRVGPLAVLAVEDTGPGIPAAERDRIFERFTQLDSGATRRAGGVGLGLYIARQLAAAQGGELLVTDPTTSGQGARFELRLPLAQQPASGVLAYTASRR